LFSIICWFIGLCGVIFYGFKRVFNLYKAESPTNRDYLIQGTVLILYSTLAVGTAQFLSQSTDEYNAGLSELSGLWVTVGLLAVYIKYLAPFVFAAIGVNMVSHSLTNQKT